MEVHILITSYNEEMSSDILGVFSSLDDALKKKLQIDERTTEHRRQVTIYSKEIAKELKKWRKSIPKKTVKLPKEKKQILDQLRYSIDLHIIPEYAFRGGFDARIFRDFLEYAISELKEYIDFLPAPVIKDFAKWNYDHPEYFEREMEIKTMTVI